MADQSPQSAGDRRGLLIDYGGVLTNPLLPVLERFCRTKGLRADTLAGLISEQSPIRAELDAYERGDVSEGEFMPRFAEQLGVTVADLDDMLVGLEPDRRMFDAVGEIRRQGVRTCLLSNSWGTALYPRELFAEAFDATVISEEVRMRKPEPEIFVLAAERVGVEPGQCVFVDDTPANFPGAIGLDMAVVHHEEPGATLRELERTLGVDLAGLI